MTQSNLSSAASGGYIPLSARPELKGLTGVELDKAIERLEYDEREERIAPYIVDINKELAEPDPLITINGSCVCSRGNISAICGEAKSRKTFLTSALVASSIALHGIPGINCFENVGGSASSMVLWVDTEQGEHHVRRVVKRIGEMSGATSVMNLPSEPKLTTLSLRELSPIERKRILYDTLKNHYYDIIVIDGIADLQRNTNDLEESDALITELMALSTQTQSHIICVLHTNPGSDKARGHLGSSLQRKAETVIYVHRNGESTIVEPQFCRNEPFERFAFEVSADGIPKLCSLTQDDNNLTDVERIMLDMYGGCVERSVLINKLMERFNLSRDAIRMKINRLINKGIIHRDGNLYKLKNIVNGANEPNEPNAPNAANAEKTDGF